MATRSQKFFMQRDIAIDKIIDHTVREVCKAKNLKPRMNLSRSRMKNKIRNGSLWNIK